MSPPSATYLSNGRDKVIIILGDDEIPRTCLDVAKLWSEQPGIIEVTMGSWRWTKKPVETKGSK